MADDDELVLLSVGCLIDQPIPNCCADIIKCSRCNEQAWISCLTKHHFQREHITNYQPVCSRCEPEPHKLKATRPPSVALHVLAKATNFFPPARHTQTKCDVCQQPAWAHIRDITYAARHKITVTQYCDLCTRGICNHPVDNPNQTHISGN